MFLLKCGTFSIAKEEKENTGNRGQTKLDFYMDFGEEGIEIYSEHYMQIMQEAETWPDWKKTYYNDNIATSAHSKKLKLEETSMNAEEIVKALKELLPEQVDYAELVGSLVPSAYGYCYVWEDPEPYIIQNGIDLIASLQDDVLRLSALNKEAMELLKAALKELMCAADDNGGCYGCIHLNADEKCTSKLGRVMCDCKTNNMWRWQHADRYEALKAKENGGDTL